MIKNLFINVVLNAVILYFVHKYDLWFKVVASEYDVYITFLVLWFWFWFFNVLLKKIIVLFTLPLKIITMWLSSLVINIIVIYIFEYVVNAYVDWIQILLWSLIQVFVLSLVFTILYLLIKKI